MVARLLDGASVAASIRASIAPEMAGVIKKSGRHEFGVHGWIHEMNTSLPDSAERALLTKALADLTRLTGTKPTGYRAPSWNFSASQVVLQMSTVPAKRPRSGASIARRCGKAVAGEDIWRAFERGGAPPRMNWLIPISKDTTRSSVTRRSVRKVYR